MPGPGEAEFDQLVGPAENEFDKLVGPGSDQQQILNATTSPNFRIGHGQEMPVTKIEAGPQPDAAGSAERGVEGKLLPNALENVFGVDPNTTYNRKLSDTVDPEDWARATQHMEELAKGPGQAAKDLAATTAAMAAGAPVGLAGQAGLSALQAGTARMADDPSATPGDIATSSGLGAGIGLGAGLATKLGAKLVSAGNRGLARLVMGPGEIGRLRGLGGEPKLEQLGQRIRDAGLTKPRNLLQHLTPTDAKRVADNAAELTAGSADKIHGLEDDLLKTNDFGQSEIDTRPLTSELRGATRPNSAEVSTDATQAAMERQAQKFDVPSEQVPVTGSVRLPPPLPGSGDVKISRDLLANGPSATPWKPTGVMPETQGVLDLGQQQTLPLPKPAPVGPASFTTQGELNLETQMPLPNVHAPEFNYHATPAENLPSISELGLRPEEGGKNFAFGKNKNSVYMSRPEDIDMWTDKIEGLTGSPPVQLRTTAPAVTPPGANPAVRVRSEPVAPERLQYKTPTGAWEPVVNYRPPPGPETQSALPLETQLPLPLANKPQPQLAPLPNAPVPPPPPGTQLGLDFPPSPIKVGGPLPAQQPSLPLESQLPLPTPPADPYVPGPLPTVQPELPGLGGSQQALPLPAPEPPPRWPGPAPQPPAEQLAMGLERLGPRPAAKTDVYGNIGGTDKPLEATASVSDPYTVERAVQDKRDIGKRLFDKKQRAFVENHGEDEAREISWRFLRDRFQKALDEGAASGAVDPQKLADYRKASADFHTAADVQVDTAKRAETELRRSDRLFYGGAQAAGHAVPGTQYNLGRLLQKAKGLPPAAVAGLPSTGQPGAERAQSRGVEAPVMSFEERKQAEKQANNDMKSSIFGSWYNRLTR